LAQLKITFAANSGTTAPKGTLQDWIAEVVERVELIAGPD
jgi:hypothetical protein